MLLSRIEVRFKSFRGSVGLRRFVLPGLNAFYQATGITNAAAVSRADVFADTFVFTGKHGSIRQVKGFSLALLRALAGRAGWLP